MCANMYLSKFEEIGGSNFELSFPHAHLICHRHFIKMMAKHQDNYIFGTMLNSKEIKHMYIKSDGNWELFLNEFFKPDNYKVYKYKVYK